MLSFPTANHIHKASSQELFVRPAGPGPHCVNWARRPLRTETRRFPIRWTWGDGERRWRKEMEAGHGAVCSPLCNPRSEERWASERDSVKTQKQRREAEWNATGSLIYPVWGGGLPFLEVGSVDLKAQLSEWFTSAQHKEFQLAKDELKQWKGNPGPRSP